MLAKIFAQPTIVFNVMDMRHNFLSLQSLQFNNYPKRSTSTHRVMRLDME